jgi:WD40 repeat protein
VKHILRLTAAIAPLALALAFAACDRGASEAGGGFSNDRDVFVAGNEVSAANVSVATYWRNGARTQLSHGASRAAANSIFVAEADVYVAGYEETAPGTSVALYWLNGRPNYLSDGHQNDTANSVFVSGGEVYVAGVRSNSATVWANGVPQNLSRFASEATSVYVSDGDVYVSGWEAGGQEKRYAMLWVLQRPQAEAEAADAAETVVGADDRRDPAAGPGAGRWEVEAQQLSGGGKNDAALSVQVSNSGTVYVAGYEEVNNITAAMLWKNGTPTQVGQNGVKSYAKCVDVSGGKVYVVLDENGFAKISTNGKKQLITDKSSRVHSVCAFGGDVYTAGTQGGQARLWLNNSQRRLDVSKASRTSEARSVFVQ